MAGLELLSLGACNAITRRLGPLQLHQTNRGWLMDTRLAVNISFLFA